MITYVNGRQTSGTRQVIRIIIFAFSDPDFVVNSVLREMLTTLNLVEARSTRKMRKTNEYNNKQLSKKYSNNRCVLLDSFEIQIEI